VAGAATIALGGVISLRSSGAAPVSATSPVEPAGAGEPPVSPDGDPAERPG
jgi:hypothetical protein